MRCRSGRLGRGNLSLLLLSVLALAALVGCGSEPPPDWPWWTAEDSASVRAELANWRAIYNANGHLADLQGGWSVGLTAQDSTSATGDTLFKFAHLMSVSFVPTDSGHRDEMLFGVTVDTIAMTDTFCEVGYVDSMEACRLVCEFDSLWVVAFRPDTQVSGQPPETTIVQRVRSTELRPFGVPETTTKSYAWSAMRKLFLSKDASTHSYVLVKATGAAIHTPTPEDAPAVTRVVLSRPGRADTFFYTPRLDGRGLYNLRSPSSLIVFEPGEEIDVEVTTSTPEDTTIDRARFFVGVEGVQTDITLSARRGQGRVTFTETGPQHIYVTVLPYSSLFYRDAEHAATVWAVPIRVVAARGEEP